MSEPRTVIDRAYAIWAQARAQYPEDRIRGVADPFGNSGMPLCRWRVSWDVMQQLTEAMPPPYSAPNPKSSYGEVKLLLGWPIDVDKSAPAGTMQLVEVGDPPAPLILHPESVLHPEDEEPSCCEELLAAERRAARYALAVESFCRACEPEGLCQTPDCALRGVSPLKLARRIA